GAAVVYAAHRDDTFLFWGALIALVSGSLVPYIRAKAESLGLTASVGFTPREARLLLFVLGGAAWAISGNSQLFAVAVAVIAFLATVPAVQRIAHVASALKNTYGDVEVCPRRNALPGHGRPAGAPDARSVWRSLGSGTARARSCRACTTTATRSRATRYRGSCTSISAATTSRTSSSSRRSMWTRTRSAKTSPTRSTRS